MMTRPLPSDVPDREARAICASPRSEIFTRNTLPEGRNDLNNAHRKRRKTKKIAPW